MTLRLIAAGALGVLVAAQAAEADRLVAKARPGFTPGAQQSRVLAGLGIASVGRAIEFELADPALAAAIGLDRYYFLELGPGRDAALSAAGVAKLVPGFESVEVEHTGGIADIYPQEPLFASQWALHNVGQGSICSGAGPHLLMPVDTSDFDVNAPAAWQRFKSAEGVRVAVLDSGITAHADLPGLKAGWAFDGGSAGDQCNHGTHVAGIIGASGTNGLGIAGIAWDVDIIPVRVLTGCTGSDANYALGLLWAADRADIVNSSLQYYSVGPMMADAVEYAAGRGVVMVAATGNHAQVVAYPARFPEVIAVGATDRHDARASFSNMGPEIDLCAPGDTVLSLSAAAQPGSGGAAYMCLSGTSMASPHIAGAAALMLGHDPQLEPDGVRQILVSGTRDLGATGFEAQHGWGRLDLARVAALTECYADADGSGTLDAMDLATFNMLYARQSPYADINRDGAWDSTDAMLWTRLYEAGCR